MQYDAGFREQLGVHDTVLLALQAVPVQLQLQGPEPETALETPALQRSATVDGAVARVVPLAVPQIPGERFALQEAVPQFHVHPFQ